MITICTIITEDMIMTDGMMITDMMKDTTDIPTATDTGDAGIRFGGYSGHFSSSKKLGKIRFRLSSLESLKFPAARFNWLRTIFAQWTIFFFISIKYKLYGTV